MDLKDFISASLVSIVEGVKDAQSKTGDTKREYGKESTGIAATMFITKQRVDRSRGSNKLQETNPIGYTPNPIQHVEFDIAVTIEDRSATEVSAEGSLGGAIKVLGIVDIDAAKLQGSAERKRERSDSTISRIRFSVPIFFPGVVYPVPLITESHEVKQAD